MTGEASSEAEKRRARLAAELRENLKRRKAQRRGREAAAGEDGAASGEPPPAEKPT